MQKKTYQKSWLLQCLFLLVYVNFFAVQVHFRYASSFAADIQADIPSSNQATKKAPIVDKSDPSKSAKPQTKLNKRFFPTPVLAAAALQFKLQPRVLVLKKETLILTPALYRTTLTCSSLRGPPSLV
ncbi:MAG: hypothetical protein J7621_16255 [Niastella sp.]|nr:hypothetical protein [Niastella sp.]